MLTAKSGDRVRVHYKGTLEDGTIFDSSEGSDPLEFVVGGGMVIPGFDQAVTGMKVGDTVIRTIAPEDAYGPSQQEMILEVEKSRFPAEIPLEVGQELQLTGGGGYFEVRIVSVGLETVTLDGNHPLAGKALTFSITLVSIN